MVLVVVQRPGPPSLLIWACVSFPVLAQAHVHLDTEIAVRPDYAALSSATSNHCGALKRRVGKDSAEGRSLPRRELHFIMLYRSRLLIGLNNNRFNAIVHIENCL